MTTLSSVRYLWIGPFIDLWSVPHLIFGFLAALGTVAFGLDIWLGWSLTSVIAVFWELFERVSGIGNEEAVTNSITDIIVAFVGFGFGVPLARVVTGKGDRIALAVLAVALFGAICIIGWLTFRADGIL